MFDDRFTEEEREIVRADFEANASFAETARKCSALPSNIAAGTVRSAKSIMRCRAELGLRRIITDNNQSVVEERIETRRRDQEFQALMLRAIKRGRESARVGVVKDDSPFVGKVIRPEPVYSGCGSAASLCADIAPEESTTGELNYA